MVVAGTDRPAHLADMTIPHLVSAVGPDFGAVGGSSELRRIVGAFLTFGLLTAVLMLVVCGTTWAIASANGSWQAASRAKTGLLVALGGAAFTGGALAWANWLLDIGASL
jgi:endonuclease/exonuclease/phosphatase (EEP) superfamily protein YafD